MSPDLLDLRRRPIPSCLEAQARKRGYRTEVTILFDGGLADEPCIEAHALGLAGDNHYNSAFNPPYHARIPGSIGALYVRQSVGERLQAVNSRLAGAGLELYLFDAWRPQAVQRYFHDVWFPEWLRKRQPDLAGPALVDEVEKYWSAPTAGTSSPSPHSTAGAVDLTLRFIGTRQPLFMGGLFDDVTEDAWTDSFERRQRFTMSDDEACANRRLLYWVMSEAGFANNPTEWWHYSWGDQMWARLTEQPAAHYGPCNPTDIPDV